MRSRYKRKKFDIEQEYNKAINELQGKKLPKEGTVHGNLCFFFALKILFVL